MNLIIILVSNKSLIGKEKNRWNSRVNLPLIYNSSKRSYNISYKTIQSWINIIENIQKKKANQS
jgi:hypothetical protein